MREVGEARRYTSGLWESASRSPESHDLLRLQDVGNRAHRSALLISITYLPLIALSLMLGVVSLIITGLLVGYFTKLLYVNVRLARSFRAARANPKIRIFDRQEGDLGLHYVMDKKVYGGDTDDLLLHMEVLDPNLIWTLNGREVKPAVIGVEAIALPSNVINFNMDMVMKGGQHDVATRDLTVLEVSELRRIARHMLKNSFFFKVAIITSIFVVPTLALAVAAILEGGFGTGGPILFVAGIALAFGLGAGLLCDKSKFKQSLTLKRAAETGYVVMAKDAIDDAGAYSYLAEYLMVTGAIWTLDGEPAEWRTEYLTQ